MIRILIYYGLLACLFLCLIFPFILQFVLTRAFKKYDLQIKIGGFFLFKSISWNLQSVNKVVERVQISIDTIMFKRIPKKFAFTLVVYGVRIKIGYHDLNLHTVQSFFSSVVTKYSFDREYDALMDNSLKIMKYIRKVFENHESLIKNKPSTASAQPTELNENKEFFRMMIMRMLISFFQKLINFQVSDFDVEIAPINQNKGASAKKITAKFEMKTYKLHYDYLRSDDFRMTNIFDGLTVSLWNVKQECLEKITEINELKIKQYQPLTLKNTNSIMRSVVETDLDKLELSMKDEHIDTLFTLIGNFYLLKKMISLCTKETKKMKFPDMYQSEFEKQKDQAKIKESMIPVMPKNIKIRINTLDIKMPLKQAQKQFDYLYLDDTLNIVYKNFQISMVQNKVEDLKHQSSLIISTKVKADTIKMKCSAMKNNMLDIEDASYSMEASIEKAIGSAIHFQNFKNAIHIKKWQFEINPVLFLIFRRMKENKNIYDTHNIKNYRPFISHMFEENEKFLKPKDLTLEQHISLISENSELIRKPQTHDQRDKYRDIKMGQNNLVMDADEIKVKFMDFDHSFFIDLHGEKFSIKRNMTSEVVNTNIFFHKSKIQNLQQSLAPLFESNEIEFHIVDRFIDEKDAKSYIIADGVQIRLNDYILLKLISGWRDYKKAYHQIRQDLNKSQDQTNSWSRFKKTFSNLYRNDMEARLHKKLIKQAFTKYSIKNISLSYDFIGDYSMKISAKSISKDSCKLKQELPQPEFDQLQFEFVPINSPSTKAFQIGQVKFVKKFELYDDNSINFNDFNWTILFDQPHVILPREFTEAGLFFKNFADSMKLLINHIRHNDDAPKKQTSKVGAADYNYDRIKHNIDVIARDFQFTIQDSKLNYTITKLHKVMRAHHHKGVHDPFEIYRNLREPAEKMPNSLATFHVKSTHLKLYKHAFAHTNIKDILEFIKSLDASEFNLLPSYFSSIKALDVDFLVDEISLKFRDYSRDVFHQKKLRFYGTIFDCQLNDECFQNDIGSLRKVFYKLKLSIYEMATSIGLSYTPALNELMDWFKGVQRAMIIGARGKLAQAVKNISDDALQKNVKKGPIISIWDKVRYRFHGHLEVIIPDISRMYLMTHLFPYSDECIMLTCDTIYLLIDKKMQFMCKNVKIKRRPRPADEGHLVKIPKSEILVKLNWICKGDPMEHFTGFIEKRSGNIINPFENFSLQNVEVFVCLNIPHDTKGLNEGLRDDITDQDITRDNEERTRMKFTRNMVKNSACPFVHIQVEFIDWILSLPQLRRDVLKMYKINMKEYEEDEVIGKDTYTDYIDLFKYQLNSQLNRGDESINPFKKISKVQLRVYINSTRVVYSNVKKPHVVDLNKEGNEADDSGDEENKQQQKIVGFQGVIDSMTFSSSFYPKDKDVRSFAIKKIRGKKKIKRKVWKMKEGLGKLNFIYIATFDGMQLVDLKPKEFEQLRIRALKKSLKNPRVFNEFFELKNIFKDMNENMNEYNPSILEIEGDNKGGQSPQIKRVYAEKPSSARKQRKSSTGAGVSRLKNFTLKTHKSNPPLQTKTTTNIELDGSFEFLDDDFENGGSLGDIQEVKGSENLPSIEKEAQIGGTAKPDNSTVDLPESKDGEQEQQPNFQRKNLRGKKIQFEEDKEGDQNNLTDSDDSEGMTDQEKARRKEKQNVVDDFDYTPYGIFFKADLLVYEQDKEAAVMDDEKSKPKEEKIEHFFTFSGGKLLVTFDLKTMMKHLVSTHKARKKVIKIKKDMQEEVNKRSTSRHRHHSSSKSKRDKTSISEDIDLDDVDEQKFSSMFGPSDGKLLRRIKFVVNIEKPQFSLQYNQRESQMLLASRKNCMITFYEFKLPFDTFGQDLKHTYKACFNSLECFVAPLNLDAKVKNSVWLDEEQLNKEREENAYITKEGMLLRIIYCNKAFFNYTRFDLEECEVDFSTQILAGLRDQGDSLNKSRINKSTFLNMMAENSDEEETKAEGDSKPDWVDDENRGANMKRLIIQQNQVLMWDDEPRINSLSIKADHLESYMDSASKKIFGNMLEFIIIFVAGRRGKRSGAKNQALYNDMLQELKHIGKKKFTSYMAEKVEEQNAIVTRKRSKVEYQINVGSFGLTSDDQTFLEMRLTGLMGSHTVYNDESTDEILQIKLFEIANLIEENPDYMSILKPLEDANYDDNMFTMKNHSYYVPGVLNKQHKWKVYEHYEYKLSPLKIRVTDEVYRRIYDYFFQDDLDQKNVKDKKSIIISIDPDKSKGKIKRDDSDDEYSESPQKGKKKKKKDKHGNKDMNLLPAFYRYIRISDVKANISIKSSSMFKRLNNVKISLSQLVKYSKFWTSKKFFDSFEKHVIRQGFGQAFSILGQKLGFKKNLNIVNEADRDFEKKRKLMTGLK